MLEGIDVVNTSLISADLIVIGIALAGVLVFSYTIGRDYGVTLLQALYMSAFTFFFLPNLVASLPDLGMDRSVANLIYLGILFAITLFILMRNGFFESPMVPSMWEIGVFGVLFTGLASVIVISQLPPEMVAGFSPITQAAFTGDPLLAFWALAPVGFWVLIKGE